MTPQIKALQRHHKRAHEARIRFFREHGIKLTPRAIVEEQRAIDRIKGGARAAE